MRNDDEKQRSEKNTGIRTEVVKNDVTGCVLNGGRKEMVNRNGTLWNEEQMKVAEGWCSMKNYDK